MIYYQCFQPNRSEKLLTPLFFPVGNSAATIAYLHHKERAYKNGVKKMVRSRTGKRRRHVWIYSQHIKDSLMIRVQLANRSIWRRAVASARPFLDIFIRPLTFLVLFVSRQKERKQRNDNDNNAVLSILSKNGKQKIGDAVSFCILPSKYVRHNKPPVDGDNVIRFLINAVAV